MARSKGSKNKVSRTLQPPKFGDIKRGTELGYSISNKFIFAPCIECKKGHWVQFVNNKPRYLRCLACARKDPHFKAMVAEAQKGNHNMLGKHHSNETKQKIAESHIGKQHTTETLRKIMKGLDIKPNKPERKLNTLLQKHFPDEWKYVGDGQIVIGGKCPDFININGRKQVIELFGEHWHNVLDTAKRTEHFKQYGFSSLIIWTSELNNEIAVLNKIRRWEKI